MILECENGFFKNFKRHFNTTIGDSRMSKQIVLECQNRMIWNVATENSRMSITGVLDYQHLLFYSMNSMIPESQMSSMFL